VVRVAPASRAGGRGERPAPGDPLPAGLIADAIAGFGLPAQADVTFLRHGENTTYRITTTDGRRFALRVNRPGYQTPEAIRSELAWMESLRASGVRTPAPVLGLDGDPLQIAAVDGGGSRTAVLFEWIDGASLSAVADLEPWVRLGELIARVHEHSRTWRPPAWFTRPAWDAEALVGDEPRWGPPDPDHAFAADDRAALDACRAEVSRRLGLIGAGPDRFGLIHGDLGFDNVLVSNDGTVTIIDFDDSGFSWYLHEFGSVLYPHEATGGLRDRRDALVVGYRRVRELSDESLSELPTFLMARRIQTLGWMFSRSETAHAERLREQRLRSTPGAVRDYLAWARDKPV
jgi:Ser/Thr protein kinase RdoA (MazF antagonist)